MKTLEMREKSIEKLRDVHVPTKLPISQLLTILMYKTWTTYYVLPYGRKMNEASRKYQWVVLKNANISAAKCPKVPNLFSN